MSLSIRSHCVLYLSLDFSGEGYRAAIFPSSHSLAKGKLCLIKFRATRSVAVVNSGGVNIVASALPINFCSSHAKGQLTRYDLEGY